MHTVLYMSSELCNSSAFLILLVPFYSSILGHFLLDCHGNYCGMLMETSTVCTFIFLFFVVVARLQKLIVYKHLTKVYTLLGLDCERRTLIKRSYTLHLQCQRSPTTFPFELF